jgi:Holliday junction DNA helicase RuvA
VIDRIRGRILERSPGGAVVIETPGGVGYALTAPLSTSLRLPPEGEEASLYTRLILREESAELFGFLTRPERDAFDILISVSRVGPRLAVTVLSSLEPPELARALAEQDLPRLASVKGIGVKTAERIMLELKDKAGRLADVSAAGGGAGRAEPSGPHSALLSEASSALQNMGYTRAEAEKALRGIAPPPGEAGDAALERLIRGALMALASGKQ